MVVDAHIHIQPWKLFRPEALKKMSAGRVDFDRIRALSDAPDELLRFLDREGGDRAVQVNYGSPEVIGCTGEGNEFVGRYGREHRDRLVAVGGVDVAGSSDPAGDLARSVDRHGVRALKLHPPHQLFRVNAYRDGGDMPRLADLYRRASELEVPVIIHTGTSIFPGARNKYGDPIGLDDVAVDFPDLKIVMAHGGRPLWMDVCFFLLRRHPNLYMDISGIPPKMLLRYFPRLEEVAGKTLFGTDWPGPGVPGVRVNIEEFRRLPLSTAARDAILSGTASSVFPSDR